MAGISTSGMGLIFSEIYPVSLSDSNNKKKSDVIRWVEKENEIVSDKGFAIQDFWSTKGLPTETVYLRK